MNRQTGFDASIEVVLRELVEIAETLRDLDTGLSYRAFRVRDAVLDLKDEVNRRKHG